MREIKGHKSRGAGEIEEIIASTGSFTFPDLPHWRYSNTKAACRKLKTLGLTKLIKRSDVQIHIGPTDLFLEWHAARKSGATALGAVRWAKDRMKKDPAP